MTSGGLSLISYTTKLCIQHRIFRPVHITSQSNALIQRSSQNPGALESGTTKQKPHALYLGHSLSLSSNNIVILRSTNEFISCILEVIVTIVKYFWSCMFIGPIPLDIIVLWFVFDELPFENNYQKIWFEKKYFIERIILVPFDCDKIARFAFERFWL